MNMEIQYTRYKSCIEDFDYSYKDDDGKICQKKTIREKKESVPTIQNLQEKKRYGNRIRWLKKQEI